MKVLMAFVMVQILNPRDLVQMLGTFAELHPVAAGLCGFAIVAILAMGIRAQIRRSAKREAWEIIAEDRRETRARQQDVGMTYRELVERQICAD